MSGVDPAAAFDDELPDDKQGISALDFEHLAPAALAVTRLILRQREATYEQIAAAAAALPAAEQIAAADLDAALRDLLAAEQVIALGDEPVRYKVNLRRKGVSGLRRGIWDALDSLPSRHSPAAERSQRPRTQKLWDALDDPTPRRPLPS
ncbi:MAG TPA: hypothetical protein VD886_00245, partial [Herpetosiphonaceae bacterium]|nr:hypothetical protein [Herpetosiphonaceae bacterium]